MEMLPLVVTITLIVYSLVNKVASRHLKLNPVSGDTLEQNQSGAQLHCSIAEHQHWWAL